MRSAKVPAPNRRSVIFTREVFDAIPIWVALGAQPKDIAEILGTTENSLRVRCSKAKISLADMSLFNRRVAVLSDDHLLALRREAMRRGVTMPRLIVAIIENLVERDAFSEVLGGYGPKVRQGTQCVVQSS